ncbi:Transcription factor RFX3 [Echinococcus granulosus]|nr:Transcription factor RFX3 [Echinococcus granulosus]
MQPGSSQGATVIQVSKNPVTTHTIIQQNSPHLLVGKLGSTASAAAAAAGSTDSPGLVTDSTTNGAVQTLLPTQYIEAAAEQTVYAATAVSSGGASGGGGGGSGSGGSAGGASGGGGSGQVGFLTLNRGDTQLRRLYSHASAVPKISYEQYQEYAPIIYTPVCGSQTYYQTVGGQVLASSGFGGAGGSIVGAAAAAATAGVGGGGGGATQIVTHQGTTYILQSATGALEEDATALSHTAKASPVTVQWLLENYETAEGVSLPRSTLYFHYLQHCHENKLEPMNPASFGKLIRSVFLGLRTRRLGTRGNSKYHYYGIRIKPSSQLNHYVEDPAFALRHYPNYHRQSMEVVAEWKSLAGKSTATSTTSSGIGANSSSTVSGGVRQGAASVSGAFGDSTVSSGGSSLGSTRTPGVVGGQNRHQHVQFLGEATSALPNLNEICRSAGLPIPGSDDGELSPRVRNASGSSTTSTKKVPSSSALGTSGLTSGGGGAGGGLDGLPTKDLIKFVILYAQSAGNMLDAVVNLDFSSIAGAWKAFWRTGDCSEDSVFEKTLSKDRLYALSKNIVVHQFIRLYDHTFYQSLAEVLIPNVLRPIPSSLTQAIRNFAKHLEVWMREALQDLDPVLLRIKLGAVSALAQTLRRYTSLNHLAQAARAVLKNPAQINQMLIDLSRVDFNNVQEQASWVCQCSDATVAHLEQDFKYILQKQSSLEEWAQWLDTVVTGILRPLEGNNLAYARAAHQLILKWSFYSSMVIRDLTLRSAASFGSFHLIRLLYDEYIFYLVEHKVAAHLGMTPVAVMGEMGRAVTRPHCNLSRATAAALVAPAGTSTIESRRSRHNLPTTSSSSSSNTTATGRGKLEAVLTAVKEAVPPCHLVKGETEVEVEATPEAILTSAATTTSDHDEAAAEADEAAICEAFATEAVFPRPSSSSPSTAARQAEVETVAGADGMVEEFLDGEEVEEEEEEEVDEDDGDENENENAMLCRAHESALLKAAEAAAAEAAAAATQKATNGDVGFTGHLNVEEEQVEKCIKVEECESLTQSQQECCDSPPPIVAHATPMRKVVRVTTFEEDASRSASGLSVEQSAGLGVSTATTATTTATSLIIPSEAKRPRLT